MSAPQFRKTLRQELPILFVNIGWAINYNGSELVTGDHAYFRNNPGAQVGEANAFIQGAAKFFSCGIGVGAVPLQPLHIVFVARDPGDRILKVVGLYAAAKVRFEEGNWGIAEAGFAQRIPLQKRMAVERWPSGQGMRRWADRKGSPGQQHSTLKVLFDALSSLLVEGLPDVKPSVDADEEGVEGKVRKLLKKHRVREGRLRVAKLRQAQGLNNGRLICEVPGCEFDFYTRYGELGAGFAEVHHKKQLGYASPKGQKIKLSDLAVVCANCHRMVHRNGECRPLESLLVLGADRVQ